MLRDSISSPDSGEPQEERACDRCNACCVHLSLGAGLVGPGLKPAGFSCPHAMATGCRIYGQRPKACADFRCIWLEDATWPELWRPDRSGLLCLKAELEEGLTAAAVYEIRPSVLQTPVAAALLTKLKQTTALIAVINAQQQRLGIRGDCRIMPAQRAVPAPHTKLRAKIGAIETR